MAFDEVPFQRTFLTPQRNGLTRPKSVRGSGLPMVNMGELFAHPRISDVAMDLVPVSDREQQFILEADDLLFARQSLVLEGAGLCSLFVGNSQPTVFESHIIRCRLDKKVADPRFYYYFFRSPTGRKAIRAIVEQGAGASGIRGSDLATLAVPHPPLSMQRDAASFLSALDDRIDNLRQTNATLEAAAAGLFKSWFVDFDGVAARDLQESELGLIPKGWRIGSVYDVADVRYGAPFASSKFNTKGDGLPLVRIRDLRDERPGVWTPEVHPKGYLIQPGDIIAGMDGEFRAYLWGGDPAWMNQRICLFHPKKPYCSPFVHRAIAPHLAHIEATEVATTVIHLGKGDIDKFRLVLPNEEVATRYAEKCQPLYDRIVTNKQQAATLASLRDTLLPRLISGRLRLPQ